MSNLQKRTVFELLDFIQSGRFLDHICISLLLHEVATKNNLNYCNIIYLIYKLRSIFSKTTFSLHMHVTDTLIIFNIFC